MSWLWSLPVSTVGRIACVHNLDMRCILSSPLLCVWPGECRMPQKATLSILTWCRFRLANGRWRIIRCRLQRTLAALRNQKWRKKNKDKVAVYLDRKREYQKEKRAFRKENNLCTLCGKVAPTEGYMTCEPCRIKRNIQRNKNKILPIYKPHWKTVLSEQGLCTVCGKPTYKNFGLCKNHYESQVDIVHRTKERRWKSEQTDSRAVQGLWVTETRLSPSLSGIQRVRTQNQRVQKGSQYYKYTCR